MGLADKFFQILLSAKRGINRIVIINIVLVAGLGLKNRRHIQDIHSQLMEVVQPVDYAPQRAVKVRGVVNGCLVPDCFRELFVSGKP